MKQSPENRALLKIPHYRILAWITLATLMAWIAWGLVVSKLDPYESTELGLPLFFISKLIALMGSFTIVLFWIKKWRARNHVYIKHLMISLRQGILLSICTTLCLGLQMLGLLRVWNGLLIVMIITLIEFYLSGRDELD